MNTTPVLHAPRTSGLRFSKVDALVLALSACLAGWMHLTGHPLWWMVIVVVGHFFLFCNVFRIRRSLELGWAVIFVLNVGWWLQAGSDDWPPVMKYQWPVTVLVIVVEMLTPSYHGIGSRFINRRPSD